MTNAERYHAATILPQHVGEVNRAAHLLMTGVGAYEHVETLIDIPFWVVGLLHMRESSFNFRCHLHNGDPLTARTVHVPKGRPVDPPAVGDAYSWHESALDVLRERRRPAQWTIATALDFMERYNGLGYQVRGVASPYLWSFTDQYAGGLFTRDGSFDAEAYSKQPGVAAVLMRLQEIGAVHLA